MAKRKNGISFDEKVRTLISLTRPVNILMVVLAIAVAIFVGINNEIFESSALFISLITVLAAVAISAAGNALNDYYDIHIDKVNRPDRPLPSGKLKPFTVWTYAITLFVIGIILSFFLPFVSIIIAVVNSILLGVYASKLKKSGFLGNILVSYLVASVFAFGAAAFGQLVIGVLLSIVAFFTNAAREVIKDLEDLEGDKIFGAKTLPILLGRKKSMFVAASFIIIAILVSPIPYLLEILSIYYILFVIIADIILLDVLYTLLRKEPTLKTIKSLQKILKLGAFLGLLAFLIGAIPF